MKNGWTGGQYSIVRAIFGIGLFVHFARRIPWTREAFVEASLLILAAVAAVFFAIGWLDRLAAVVIWCVLAWFSARNLPLLAASSLLLWHALLPRAPFLSVAARGRVDPRGGWSMPRPMYAAVWIVMAVAYGLLARNGFADFNFLMLFLPLFAFDPAWVPGRAPETTDEVFYDGTCGLCHSGMRWLVAEDPTGTSFRYAPLFGDAFAAAFPGSTDLPDSVIVKTAAGAVLVRSDAAVHLLARLGGLWRIFGVVFGALPRRVRDAMYDFVARIRYRIFGRKKDACPLMPADLRSRFTV
jgi:predicted DCC family thiol-disulfide oxidoreductase YuxK